MYTLWRTDHEINREIMDAFYRGSVYLSSTEEGFHYKSVNDYIKPVPSISYGVLRGTGKIFKDCLKNKTEFWEIDRGYFKPGHFDGYYRITMNSLRIPFRKISLPNDRLNKLNIKLLPWKKGKHILYVPPTDYIREYYEIPKMFDHHVMNKINKSTSRPIRTRAKGTAVPLENDLKDCHAVVTFNSNVAVEATIQGIPSVSFTKEFPIGSIDNIEDGFQFDREEWLRLLSYSQFTLDEFRSGKAWTIAQKVQKYACI